MLAVVNAGGQRMDIGRGDARQFGAQSAEKTLALSTFSGLLWGGGGMVGKLFRYERLADACCVEYRSRAARASLWGRQKARVVEFGVRAGFLP